MPQPIAVTGISAVASRAGTLNASQTVAFTLSTAAAVQVTGSPTLLLSNGGTATYDAVASTGASLVFRYTVAAGQDTTDLQVSGLSLNGGAIAAPATIGFGAATTYAAGTGPDSVTTADLNGDGKPDLVVANYTDNTVSVLLNNGSGGFGAATTYAAGTGPSSVTTADLNGDSKPDLVVADYAGNTVSVLLNNGSGGFGTATTYAVGSLPTSVTTADLNGDGKPDLVVANYTDNNVSVLLNNGSGGFGTATTYAAGSRPTSVTTADLNGDGKPDLVVADSVGNTVSVLLNNGSGGFGTATTYAVGSNSGSVTTADLNGDGKPDLVVANDSDNTVSVLLNNGSGGFGTATTYAVGSQPNSVTMADLNGDGKPDLVVANESDNTVSVLLNNGSGGFGAATSYAAGSRPNSVTTADLNGDGKPDLVVADNIGNAVSVLLNNSIYPVPLDTAGAATATGHDTGLRVDTMAPAAPVISSANLTNNTAPVIAGTAEAGSTLTLAVGGATYTTLATGGAWSVNLATATPATGSLSLNANGANSVSATATDAANNTSVPGLQTLTIDTTPPAVTETLAHDTGVSATDHITSNPALSGSDDPNAVVTLTQGTTVLGSTTASNTGAWTYTPTLTDGAHTLVASETDAAGNTGTATLTFTLDTVAPAVTGTLTTDTGASATDHVTSNPALSGTGDANTTVTLTEGTTVLGSTTASNSGAWTYTPTLSDGAHTLVASETDAAGNTGTSTLTFTLDTVAPAVTETLVHDTGASATDHITSNPALSGTGDPNAVVTLTEGTTVIGSTTAGGTGAWTYTSTLPDGTHTIVASETDTAGNTGTATLTFTLDTIAPVVTETLTIDTGNSNSDHLTNNPSLSGTGDANASVLFTEGTTVLGSTTADGTGAWTYTPTLANGAHTIVASETNTAGNTGTSTLTFTLDTIAPAVTESLTTDTGSSATDHITNNPALSGTGDPNAVVTLTEGTTLIGTTTASGTGAWTYTPTLSDGAHTIVASETDTAGNTGTATLTFTLDTIAPVVTETLTIDTGNSNSDHLTNNPSLSGTGDANASVLFTEGTTVLGSTTADGTGAWTYTPTLANGAHTIVASETNTAGNTGTSTLTFTLDTIAPAVTESLTTDTGSSATDHITNNPALSGTGDPNAVVTLTEGTTLIGTTTASGTGAWTYTPTLSDGAHTIVASETDTAGNTGTATLTFTLDTIAPVVTETLTIDTGNSNSDHLTNNPSLSGTGDANASVLFTEGTTVLGSTTADGTGAWTFTPILADGLHTVVASETDTAGNTGTSTLTFTLDTVAPTVIVTLISDTGSSNTDYLTSNPALSGTADANAVVTLTEGTTIIGSTTADGTGAWSYTPTLSDGAYSIVASETNAAGNTGTATITFDLDTTAPLVTEALANDTGGSNSDHITSNPALSGTGDANTTVTLTEGTTIIGSTTADGTGAWTYTPTLADGAHSIVASETDTAGNTGTATITFTLDTIAPAAPAITSPDLTDVAAPIITGAAEAGSIVTLTVDSATYTTLATGDGWSVNLATATPDSGGLSLNVNGANSVSATATDPAGNISTSVTQTLTIDTTAPDAPTSLTLAAGSDSGVLGDEITNVTTPTLTGTGETGDTLTLYDGDFVIGTTTVVNGAWSVTPSVALTAGVHGLTARQTDPAGNVSAASAILPLDIITTPPPPPVGTVLAAGSDSGTLGDGITSVSRPVISGSGVTGGTVDIYDGTTLLGSTTVAEGGAWSFTPGSTLADGTHTLTITQTDLADNVSAASAPFALTIDTVAPNVTAALAANPHNTASTTYNQVLNGGGDPNASVTILDGGVAVGAATADASGAWSFDLAGLAAGSHSLIASETDAAGNTGASTPVPLTMAPGVVSDARFTVTPSSAATSGSFFGSDYAGPLPGLQAQYGYSGTANVNLIANVANAFIYSGTAGEDAMVANSGSNVLDSRGGSDWMIGASGADGGTDTFFVDSRASGSPTTWDTALNFHLGDKLTIWDFSPTSGNMSFIDNLGQPGYLGTTLLANLGNGATDLVTFTGLSGAGAQFATSTGVSGGLGYLALTRVA